jgi:hypothetical protein
MTIGIIKHRNSNHVFVTELLSSSGLMNSCVCSEVGSPTASSSVFCFRCRGRHQQKNRRTAARTTRAPPIAILAMAPVGSGSPFWGGGARSPGCFGVGRWNGIKKIGVKGEIMGRVKASWMESRMFSALWLTFYDAL